MGLQFQRKPQKRGLKEVCKRYGITIFLVRFQRKPQKRGLKDLDYAFYQKLKLIKRFKENLKKED